MINRYPHFDVNTLNTVPIMEYDIVFFLLPKIFSLDNTKSFSRLISCSSSLIVLICFILASFPLVHPANESHRPNYNQKFGTHFVHPFAQEWPSSLVKIAA